VGGSYLFSGLPYQGVYFYEVRIVVPSGWVATQPATSYTFLLNPGEQCFATGIDFGIRQNTSP
jgi:hypothetical protein